MECLNRAQQISANTQAVLHAADILASTLASLATVRFDSLCKALTRFHTLPNLVIPLFEVYVFCRLQTAGGNQSNYNQQKQTQGGHTNSQTKRKLNPLRWRCQDTTPPTEPFIAHDRTFHYT